MTDTLKIITDPTVFLVGRQSIDPGGLSAFLESEGVPDWTTDAESASETLVEVAGRTCYLSFAKPRPGGNSAYIGHVLEVGHGSVIEHAQWNLIVTGVSRSLSHELVRHRVGMGISQLSQRFVDESGVGFVVPPAYERLRIAAEWVKDLERHNDKCFADGRYGDAYPSNETEGELSARWHRWLGVLADCLSYYRDQSLTLERFHPVISQIADKTLRRKRAREAARSVLPNCTETKLFLTLNARAARHVLEMRGDLAADLEFRRLAAKLAGVFKAVAGNLFGDVEVGTGEDGWPIVTSKHQKV